MKIFFVLTLLWVHSSSAQIARNFEQQERPKYELGAGVAGFDLPDYAGSKNNQFRWLPFPFFMYRGDVLRTDEEGTRAKIEATKDYEFGMTFGFNFPVESNQNPAREGMPDLDGILGFGPQIMFRFLNDDKKQKLNLTFGLRGSIAFNDNVESREEGVVFEPSLSYWRYLGKDNYTILFVSLEGEFGDKKANQYFYDVDPAFVTADRESYEAKAGLIKTAVIAGVSHTFTPKLTAFLGGFYNDLSQAANVDSPLVEVRQNQGFLAGIFWLFTESKERTNIFK
jgi:outer membrane protein